MLPNHSFCSKHFILPESVNLPPFAYWDVIFRPKIRHRIPVLEKSYFQMKIFLGEKIYIFVQKTNKGFSRYVTK